MGQFTRALEHLNRVFRPFASKGKKVGQVSFFPDAVFLNADVFGTQKYQDAELVQQVTSGLTSSSEFTPVPNDEVWFVLAHSGLHTQGAVNRNLQLRIRYSSGALNQSIYLTPTRLTPGFGIVACPRSYYAPPRSRIGIDSLTNIPVGFELIFRAIIIRLPLGEYTAR